MAIQSINSEFFSNDAQTNFDPKIHADIGFDISSIANDPTNYLIEGIRGTGKTHILKMLRNEMIANFSPKRILPIYISLAKYSEYECLTDAEFRLHLYTSIVESAVSVIKENRKLIENASDPIFIKKLKAEDSFLSIDENISFDSYINEIESSIKILNENLYTGQIKIIDSKELEGDGSIGTTSFCFGAKAKKGKNVEYILEQLHHKNASRYIISFFKTLKEILQLDYSVLLIDEISGVSNEKQLEIFRLLKLIRSSDDSNSDINAIYFIGGVYPPHSTNYPSKAKGMDFEFKTGEDCTMKFLENDVLSDEYEKFFQFLIKKRLDKYHEESEGDLMWIFEDKKSFLLSAFAANGFPRRFFQLISVAYENIKKRNTEGDKIHKIDFAAVSSAIQLVVDNEILDENHLTEQDFMKLENIIIPKIRTRNASTETKNANQDKNTPIHLFIKVSRVDIKKLNNLMYRGVIHNLNRTRKSKNISSETPPIGKVLMVDFAVAFYYRLFNTQMSVNYFQNDLRDNAKRGFLYFTEIKFDVD